MKFLKTRKLSTLSLASLALFLFACGAGGNTAANNSTSNTVNKTTTTNSSPAANTTPTPASKPSTTPSGESEDDQVQGELQVGKTESVILYVGEETGDYAGYCFTNDSEAGRAIMAACKDKERCEVTGKVDHEAGCKVPGLEATLSDSGKIVLFETGENANSG